MHLKNDVDVVHRIIFIFSFLPPLKTVSYIMKKVCVKLLSRVFHGSKKKIVSIYYYINVDIKKKNLPDNLKQLEKLFSTSIKML